MGNQSIVRIKNFQADYDFRICNLSVSIYCVGSGNLVLDMINKQTKELVLENIEVRDGTQSIQCDLDNGIYNFKIYEVFLEKMFLIGICYMKQILHIVILMMLKMGR